MNESTDGALRVFWYIYFRRRAQSKKGKLRYSETAGNEKPQFSTLNYIQPTTSQLSKEKKENDKHMIMMNLKIYKKNLSKFL